MYIDLAFLFLIYAFATISLAVSIYALWTLKELEELYKHKNKRKTNNAWDHYHNKAKQPTKSRAEGYFDKYINK
jgi:hypothetical protein